MGSTYHDHIYYKQYDDLSRWGGYSYTRASNNNNDLDTIAADYKVAGSTISLLNFDIPGTMNLDKVFSSTTGTINISAADLMVNVTAFELGGTAIPIPVASSVPEPASRALLGVGPAGHRWDGAPSPVCSDRDCQLIRPIVSLLQLDRLRWVIGQSSTGCKRRLVTEPGNREPGAPWSSTRAKVRQECRSRSHPDLPQKLRWVTDRPVPRMRGSLARLAGRLLDLAEQVRRLDPPGDMIPNVSGGTRRNWLRRSPRWRTMRCGGWGDRWPPRQ
jgi:hypothetical protein